ncbi:MAG TPA: flagellar hook capping FlgD N-terminal domain-containing protein [Stellaceae bacterium]|nr:flagellar hook capping FlgD N-terminal domain-containing protein [Stellaceae bacterium]
MITAASAMPASVATLPAGTQLPTGASGVSGGQTLSENNFFQLLTAQLENQDPLNPMTNDQFAAELAQFSTANGVQNLDASFSGQQAVALVGHNVAVGGNALVLGASGNATGAFNLSAAAKDVAVTITDASGKQVATLDLGAMAAGTQTFSWDGKGASPGTYQFNIRAVGAAGNSVAATPYAVVPVTAAILGGQNGPMLDLGGGLAPVALGAVQQVL